MTDAADGLRSEHGPDSWISHPRLLVLFVAVAAYANSLGNGFAYDDNRVVAMNPVVTLGRWSQALLGPYWQGARPGSGLYRPVTIASLTAEWHTWGASTVGFHAVNLALHAVICVLLYALLRRFLSSGAASAGAILFAIHPIHVEAVANVVGISELLAAASFLGACLLYLDGARRAPAARAVRLAGLALLYLLGLGSKEIAVTLPAALVLLEAFRPLGDAVRGSERPGLAARLRAEAPVFVALIAVLGAYLVLRLSVLGTMTGEVPAPALRGLPTADRVLTALTVWPEYLRLLVFPADLSADYSPAVLMVAHGVNLQVVLGAVMLMALVGLTWLTRERAPVMSLGLGWFLVTILPVSNLIVPAGILLAERTLYLPSVGLAFIVAGMVSKVASEAGPSARRVLGALAVLAGVALFVRTVARNPTWMSSYTVLNTLAIEHPESSMALQHRAEGLERVGDIKDAARMYDAAATLAPNNYALAVEIGDFYGRLREYSKADAALRRAIRIVPDQAPAYRLLAAFLIRQGRAREGYGVALRGLAAVGPDRELWSLVSESYVAKGDLEAAVRARRAALGMDPASSADWSRLADLLAALGRTAQADSAKARALATDTTAVPAGHRVGRSGGHT
ncbi:MAG: tetratricopeptide repeat protein [Gemmatimonadetes bacterium]|nr:tetratricopeptide repeat protein [Gemmatimonadota bacterium]